MIRSSCLSKLINNYHPFLHAIVLSEEIFSYLKMAYTVFIFGAHHRCLKYFNGISLTYKFLFEHVKSNM